VLLAAAFERAKDARNPSQPLRTPIVSSIAEKITKIAKARGKIF